MVGMFMPPPNSYVAILAPKVDGSRGWGAEVIGVESSWMDQCSIKEAPKGCLPSPPCEDLARRHQLHIRKCTFTQLESCWYLEFGLPSPWNCEQPFSVVYKLPRLCYFVMAPWTDKDIYPVSVQMSAFAWFLNRSSHEACTDLLGGWEGTVLVHIAGSGQRSMPTEHILYWVE